MLRSLAEDLGGKHVDLSREVGWFRMRREVVMVLCWAGTRAASPHNDGCPDELGHDFQWRLGGRGGQVEGGELAMWCEGR